MSHVNVCSCGATMSDDDVSIARAVTSFVLRIISQAINTKSKTSFSLLSRTISIVAKQQ